MKKLFKNKKFISSSFLIALLSVALFPVALFSNAPEAKPKNIDLPDYLDEQVTVTEIGSKKVELSFTFNQNYHTPDGIFGQDPIFVAVKLDKLQPENSLSWITLDNVISGQTYTTVLDYSSYAFGDYTIQIKVDTQDNVFDLVAFSLQESRLFNFTTVSSTVGNRSVNLQYQITINSGYGHIEYDIYTGTTPTDTWTIDRYNYGTQSNGQKVFWIDNLTPSTAYNVRLRTDGDNSTIVTLSFSTSANGVNAPAISGLNVLSVDNKNNIEVQLFLFTGDFAIADLQTVSYAVTNDSTQNYIQVQNPNLVAGYNTITVANPSGFLLEGSMTVFIKLQPVGGPEVINSSSVPNTMSTYTQLTYSNPGAGSPSVTFSFDFQRNNDGNTLFYRTYLRSYPPTQWIQTNPLVEGINTLTIDVALTSVYVFEITNNPSIPANISTLDFSKAVLPGNITITSNFVGKTLFEIQWLFMINGVEGAFDYISFNLTEDANPSNSIRKNFIIESDSLLAYVTQWDNLSTNTAYTLDWTVQSTGFTDSFSFTTLTPSTLDGNIEQVNINQNTSRISFDINISGLFTEIYYRNYESSLIDTPDFTYVYYRATNFTIDFEFLKYNTQYTFDLVLDNGAVQTITYTVSIENAPVFNSTPKYSYSLIAKELTITFSANFSFSSHLPLIEYTYYGYNSNSLWGSYTYFVSNEETTFVVRNVSPRNNINGDWGIDVFVRIPYNTSQLFRAERA